MQTRDLIIDDQLVAKYEFEREMLYLKTLVYRWPENPSKSEDYLVDVIQLREGRTFDKLAYLNI